MIVSDFLYVDDLHLVRFKQGGGGLFTLTRDYRVFFKLDGVDHMYTVPNGFHTDLASIPRVFQGVIEKLGNHIEAAVVHDHLCLARPWTHQVAAEIFNAGMYAARVPDDTRQLMYLAVLLGGPRWG